MLSILEHGDSCSAQGHVYTRSAHGNGYAHPTKKAWAVVDYQNDRRQSWKRRFLRRPAVEVHNEGLMQLSLLEHLRSTYGFEMLLLECQYRMLPDIAAWPCFYYLEINHNQQDVQLRRTAVHK